MAVEDVGLAEPAGARGRQCRQDAYASLVALEGELALVQAIVYLATAPKSNAAYVAFRPRDQAAKGNRLA